GARPAAQGRCSFPLGERAGEAGPLVQPVVRREKGPLVPPRDPGACVGGIVSAGQLECGARSRPRRPPATIRLRPPRQDPIMGSCPAPDPGCRISSPTAPTMSPPDVERPPHHPVSPRRSLVMISLPARGWVNYTTAAGDGDKSEK